MAAAPPARAAEIKRSQIATAKSLKNRSRTPNNTFLWISYFCGTKTRGMSLNFIIDPEINKIQIKQSTEILLKLNKYFSDPPTTNKQLLLKVLWQIQL